MLLMELPAALEEEVAVEEEEGWGEPMPAEEEGVLAEGTPIPAGMPPVRADC